MKTERFEYARADGESYLRLTEFADSPFQRNRLHCIVELLRISSPKPPRERKILEIGCGTGNVAIPLAGLGYPVKAIDIDPASIRVAKEKNPFDNLTLAVLPMEQENPAAFDVVILTEVLEHIPDAEGFMQALCSRMKPDSLLLLTVPNGRGISELFFRPAYRLKSRGRGLTLIARVRRLLGTRELTTANVNTPHLHFFTRKRLTEIFKNNHLLVLRFQRIFFIWTLLESLFSARWLPETLARMDYALARKIHPAFSSTWFYLLGKEDEKS